MIDVFNAFQMHRFLLSIFCLIGIHFTAPWPNLQSIIYTFLVLGLIPSFDSPLTGIIWAAISGWTIEGTLRLYPKMGGTAFASMLTYLLIFNLFIRWPPNNLKSYWGIQAILVVIHALFIHLFVKLIVGPHAWGSNWLWSFISIPIWATAAMYLYYPLHRK